MVDDPPDFYIVGGHGWADGDDSDVVWRRAPALDAEREVAALGGHAGESEGICIGERTRGIEKPRQLLLGQL